MNAADGFPGLGPAPAAPRFHTLVGTGGIGTGQFFRLAGNHRLGREESRSGRFLDRRDYCKLHIIAHYVQALTGSWMRVLPVGRVGADAAGERLCQEMREAGLDVRYVTRDDAHPTLSCICLVYPDGSGGNLTVDDAASGAVTPADIDAAEAELAAAGAAGMVLAAPEVPLAARRRLLALGTRYGAFRAASFVSGEMDAIRHDDTLAHIDLLALNRDEAAALAGLDAQQPVDTLVQAADAWMRARRPEVLLSVTAGKAGSWLMTPAGSDCLPALEVPKVESTAGAGDAHLSGLLAGLAAGLAPEAAHVLGSLSAAMSVTSPHTIHPDLSRTALAECVANDTAPRLSEILRQRLGLAHISPDATASR